MLPADRAKAERLLAQKLSPFTDGNLAADTLPPPSGFSRPPSLVTGNHAELSFVNMMPELPFNNNNNTSTTASSVATTVTVGETDPHVGPQAPFYMLSATTIQGREYPFSQLRGKVVLIVNVASKCGFTPQYKGLQALYDKYKDRGFVVLGFPCDQFGNQEPADEPDIEIFCQRNYGVTFPMMSKVHVNGHHTHPVYEFLKKEHKQFLLEMIKWNFEKFLVDREGNVVQRFSSMADAHKHLEPAVEKLLSA